MMEVVVTNYEASEAAAAKARAIAARFTVGIRGYEKAQVETRLAELVAQLDQARRRADKAEQSLTKAEAEVEAVRSLKPSFEHLGAEAAKILEQAGASAESMLGDARDRGRKAIEEAEATAAERLAAAEARAADLERAARKTLEDAKNEGARIEEDARKAGEHTRKVATEEARTVLAEARDATNVIWQEFQRERVVLEGEIERLSALRWDLVNWMERIRGQLDQVLVEVHDSEIPLAKPNEPVSGGKTGEQPAQRGRQGRQQATATATGSSGAAASGGGSSASGSKSTTASAAQAGEEKPPISPRAKLREGAAASMNRRN
jgi:chromosome segregation ATPase